MVASFLLVIRTNIGDSACAGAAMISNSPGTVADITNETYRALAFSIWSIGPMNGPVTGPLIGGFAAEYLGWRWTNWLVLIFSGVAWGMCACVKETYAPIILQRKAAKRREETGDERWWSRYDQNATGKHICSACYCYELTRILSHRDPEGQSFKTFRPHLHRTDLVVLGCLHCSTCS
jgi:MFS family permease